MRAIKLTSPKGELALYKNGKPEPSSSAMPQMDTGLSPRIMVKAYLPITIPYEGLGTGLKNKIRASIF